MAVAEKGLEGATDIVALLYYVIDAQLGLSELRYFVSFVERTKERACNDAPVRRSLLNFDLSPAPSHYLLRREREGEGEMIDR